MSKFEKRVNEALFYFKKDLNKESSYYPPSDVSQIITTKDLSELDSKIAEIQNYITILDADFFNDYFDYKSSEMINDRILPYLYKHGVYSAVANKNIEKHIEYGRASDPGSRSSPHVFIFLSKKPITIESAKKALVEAIESAKITGKNPKENIDDYIVWVFNPNN